MVFRGTFWDLAEAVTSFSCLYSDLCIVVIIFPLLIPASFVKWYSVLFAILGNWWNFIVVRQAKELILIFSSPGKIAKVGKGAHEPKAQTAEAYTGFRNMKHAYEYCYSPLDGMLVHRRVTPHEFVTGTPLYTWVKRDKVEYSFLSKETTRRARLAPRTFRSRVWGVNRSATHASTREKIVAL